MTFLRPLGPSEWYRSQLSLKHSATCSGLEMAATWGVTITLGCSQNV